MIEQKSAPKALKLEVKHGETSATLQTKDTSLLDAMIVGLIIFGAIAITYIFKRTKLQ